MFCPSSYSTVLFSVKLASYLPSLPHMVSRMIHQNKDENVLKDYSCLHAEEHCFCLVGSEVQMMEKFSKTTGWIIIDNVHN